MCDPSGGAPLVRALSRASHPFLACPPEGFVDVPLLSPRGVLAVAFAGQEALVEEAKRNGRNGYAEVDGAFARSRLPPARRGLPAELARDGIAPEQVSPRRLQ